MNRDPDEGGLLVVSRYSELVDSKRLGRPFETLLHRWPRTGAIEAAERMFDNWEGASNDWEREQGNDG